jgi:hypothetical protein
MAIKPARAKCFADKLPPEDQEELLELRRDFQAGKLPSHVTQADLFRIVHSRFGQIVGDAAFREWLKRND